MPERDLENVMLDFANYEFDILICTTIIESGLDIPNANTIIIDEADKLGLARLYQIRGRVGRSNVQAYAYCFYRPEKVISETAQNRLKAIREFTSLGSGYQIALRDMEIRGVGNILGGSNTVTWWLSASTFIAGDHRKILAELSEGGARRPDRDIAPAPVCKHTFRIKNTESLSTSVRRM